MEDHGKDLLGDLGLGRPFKRPADPEGYAKDAVSPTKAQSSTMRQFDSGATRNIDTSKFDYEGFINPEVLHAFGEFMHSHRLQKDGTLRDSDNWQKGIPLRVYMSSLVRHVLDLWRMHRGFHVTNPDTGLPHTKQELACAIMFNVMGYLKEMLDPAPINQVDEPYPQKTYPEPGR